MTRRIRARRSSGVDPGSRSRFGVSDMCDRSVGQSGTVPVAREGCTHPRQGRRTRTVDDNDASAIQRAFELARDDRAVTLRASLAREVGEPAGGVDRRGFGDPCERKGSDETDETIERALRVCVGLVLQHLAGISRHEARERDIGRRCAAFGRRGTRRRRGIEDGNAIRVPLKCTRHKTSSTSTAREPTTASECWRPSGAAASTA